MYWKGDPRTSKGTGLGLFKPYHRAEILALVKRALEERISPHVGVGESSR